MTPDAVAAFFEAEYPLMRARLANEAGIRTPPIFAVRQFVHDCHGGAAAYCERHAKLNGWIMGFRHEMVFAHFLAEKYPCEWLRGLLLHEAMHAACPLDSYAHGPDFTSLCSKAAPLYGFVAPVLGGGTSIAQERPESWPMWGMILNLDRMPVQPASEPFPAPIAPHPQTKEAK